MLKKSLVLQGLFPASVTTIEALKSSIQLVGSTHFYDTVEFSYLGPREDNRNIAALLSEWNLNAILLTPGYRIKTEGLDPGSPEKSVREAALEAIKQGIDDALEIGAHKVLILSGPNPGGAKIKDYFKRTCDVIEESCDYADRAAGNAAEIRELSITLEYFPDKPPVSMLIGPTEMAVEAAKIIRAKTDRFELTFDTSHIAQLKEDPVDSLQSTAPFVRHIHFANCVIDDPDHPWFGDRHPPIGCKDGAIDENTLAYFYRSAIDILDFQTEEITVGAEIICPEGYDAEQLVRETTDLMKRVIV